MTDKGGPVALVTASQLFASAARARPSSRDTPGPRALAMAASADTSFSAGPSFPGVDGLPEAEKNSGEPENTYILRPIFQQRRVADGVWHGDVGVAGLGERTLRA